MDPFAAEALMRGTPPTFTAPEFQMTQPSRPSPFAPSGAMPPLTIGAPPEPAAAPAAAPMTPSAAMPVEPPMTRGVTGPVLERSPEMPQGPAPGRNKYFEQRQMNQASDLMRRITTAEQAGDFKKGRELRQLLGDLLR